MLSLTIRYCLQRAVCNLSAKKPDILHIKLLKQFVIVKMTSFDLAVFKNEIIGFPLYQYPTARPKSSRAEVSTRFISWNLTEYLAHLP